MAGFVLMGMLAAFGLVCALWVLAGLLLPREPGGVIIYLGSKPVSAAQRYLWLREMGLSCDRFVVLSCVQAQRQWLVDHGIEICSREELIRRLKMGEKEIDAGT